MATPETSWPPGYTLTHHATCPSDPLFAGLFNLLKNNMRTLYMRSTMGWSSPKKQQEMRIPTLQYFVLMHQPQQEEEEEEEEEGEKNDENQGDQNNKKKEEKGEKEGGEGKNEKLAAFASFMVTKEDGVRGRVVYLYEIQVDPAHQGKRLGEQLMKCVEAQAVAAVAKGEDVTKVMLTVFSENKGARRFYERLGYEVDDISPKPPQRSLRSGRQPEPSYYIFSKSVSQMQ